MTTIPYDRPIKDFIAGLNATGHVSHRSYKKTSVTFHHNGGKLSLKGILDVWKTRPASAHFQTDKVGALGQYVKVNEYAWAVGNTSGNQSTISIEMANETLAPTWRVADATWQSAARLGGWLHANVLDGQPRPSSSTVFPHHHWKSTDCFGPYMDSIYPKLLSATQQYYDIFKGKVPSDKDVTIDARALNRSVAALGFNPGDAWFNDCKQFMAWAAHPKINVITVEQRDYYANCIAVKKDFAYAGRMMEITIKRVQAKFNLKVDGYFGATTARVLRGYGYNVVGA
jgi:peptidoglycan hydrolase-like protein with peptidoglycan-binding domain